MAKIKKIKRSSISVNSAHQKIEDHEKLCRIMQMETNKKITELKYQMCRLEKIVLYSIGMLIVGMATIIVKLFERIL
tara:strand:- start:1426 stop:1656 length:231 start_codon:yes stop_codon:yes gene_type:complete